MWKLYENFSVKWVCQIKNRDMVTGIDTGHYSILGVVSKYRVLWHRIAHHYCLYVNYSLSSYGTPVLSLSQMVQFL